MIQEKDEYMAEATELTGRAGIRFDAMSDEFLTLLLDIAHHLEAGRMVVLIEDSHNGCRMCVYQ